MPLLHSEDVARQRRSIEEFERQREGAQDEIASYATDAVKYARMHAAIIERFGRFPHRNQILGRESTSEELEFLKQPGSSF
jgi:uncharacterized protein (DUF924 family)